MTRARWLQLWAAPAALAASAHFALALVPVRLSAGEGPPPKAIEIAITRLPPPELPEPEPEPPEPEPELEPPVAEPPVVEAPPVAEPPPKVEPPPEPPKPKPKPKPKPAKAKPRVKAKAQAAQAPAEAASPEATATAAPSADAGPSEGEPGPAAAPAPPPPKEVAAVSVPPPPAPAPERKAVDLGPYRKGLHRALMKHRRYPRMAQRLELEGVATVRLVLDRQGRLVGEPTLVQSAGHELLDAEALRMVRAAAPFTAMPVGVDRERTSFEVPIRFQVPR